MTNASKRGPTFDEYLTRKRYLSKAIAEFRYNALRLGDVEIAHRSNTLRETRLVKRSEELLVLALALGCEKAVSIVIDDDDGCKERPDFGVMLDRRTVGVEVTTLRRPHAAEAEAVRIRLNRVVNAQLLQDPKTREFLAACIVTCRLHRLPAAKDTQKLVTEIVASFHECIQKAPSPGLRFVPKHYAT